MSDEGKHEAEPLVADGLSVLALPTSERISAIVYRLFEAGLALDSMQHSLESEYGKRRAGAAGAALEAAICDLRSLAITLEAGG
jgi:hypothetical protein